MQAKKQIIMASPGHHDTMIIEFINMIFSRAIISKYLWRLALTQNVSRVIAL